MTDTTADAKALVIPPRTPGSAPAPKIVEVARKYGVSPFRQLKEMIRLNRGPGRVATHEYYSAGLYDPAISWEEKLEYVGLVGSWNLNLRISPAKLTTPRFSLQDKVLFTTLLNSLGFAATKTQAVVQPGRLFGPIAALWTADDIRDFLQNRAEFPVFAKPLSASGSFGSALLKGVEGDTLVLGDGRRVALDAFCTEVLTDYPDGFLFQDALVQHADMSAMTGNAIGSLRVVTVRDGDLPRPLYTVWKLPSPKAMSDNFWQEGSMVAEVGEDGRLGRCRIGTGLDGRWIDTHPVSGLRFAEFRIPHFEAVLDTASRVHAIYPELGVIGWDIAVGPDGPVIIEANDNPFHSLYQLANGRGVLNADFTPVFDRTAERSEAMIAERKGLSEARKEAKSREKTRRWGRKSR